jgi:hypothetical protein
MGQGDVPTSRGGPLRRRKEKRQLEHLAASTAREGTPQASAAHVKLIGDQPASPVRADPEKQEADASEDGAPQPRVGGFHVRAVPIDQPVGD